MGERSKTDTAQTIADFMGGSHEAFGVLYDHYAPALFGELVRMIDNRPLAEDILQQSFITAWKNRSTCMNNTCGFFPWLLSIARNILAEAGAGKEKGSTTNRDAGKEVYTQGSSISLHL